MVEPFINNDPNISTEGPSYDTAVPNGSGSFPPPVTEPSARYISRCWDKSRETGIMQVQVLNVTKFVIARIPGNFRDAFLSNSYRGLTVMGAEEMTWLQSNH